MATFDLTFDYIELLGMTPEEVRATSVDQLRACIATQKKELTRSEQNPLYSQRSRAAKERLLQFEKLLEVPDALTAYVNHQQEARASLRREQEASIARLVAVALMSQRAPASHQMPTPPPRIARAASWKLPPGEAVVPAQVAQPEDHLVEPPPKPPVASILTRRQYELLIEEARALGISNSVVASVLRAMDIEVKKKPKVAAGRPELPRASDAMETAVFSDIHNWLKVLDKPNLFAFLGLQNEAPPAQLVASARLLYHKWSRMLPKSSVSTAWEKCAQACLTYLKSDDSKDRYLRALSNFRIDQFVKRVDLLLAGESFGASEHQTLVTIGVQEFGLSPTIADRTILARAFALGVTLRQPLTVTFVLNGHTQCRQCFAWTNPFDHDNCLICGNSLSQACANPECRQLVPAGKKACPKCQLPVFRSKQFVRLLELIDVLLDVGHATTAIDACALAEQIFRGPATASRLARATKIRSLVAALRESIAAKCWNKSHQELQQLAQIAPRFSAPGIPRLETIIKYKARQRKRISDASSSTDVNELVTLYVSVLNKWADCQEAIQKSRLLARTLVDQKQFALARTLIDRLQDIQPRDLETISLVAVLNRLTRKVEENDDHSSSQASPTSNAIATTRSETTELHLTDVRNEEILSK